MLFILLTAVFVVLRILPGDPILALWGGRTPPPDAVARARVQLGLGVRLYGIVIWVSPLSTLGLILQLVFGVWLRWLPAIRRWTGVDSPCGPPSTCRFQTGMYTVDSLIEGNLGHFATAVSHLLLPSLTLGLVLSGFFAKTVRANMLRTIGADFTEAARARGVPRRAIIYRHAFKNALVPVVTVLGLQFAILFAGAVLTEKTFSYQ